MFKRREFIALLGGMVAAAGPIRACAQQASMPVIGFLSNASPDTYEVRLRAFRQGLAETGFVEGQNVAIEYRWAIGDNEKLPMLAAELVRRQVAVIVSGGGTPSALAAKEATPTIPIVFSVAANPVHIGLVARLNKPGGNLTGVTNLNAEVGPKRLEVLRELLPTARSIAILVNPTSRGAADLFLQDLSIAARTIGMQLQILQASTDADLESAFTALAQLRADALVVSPDVFFNTRSELLAALSLRHAIPSIYQYRRFATAGGLVSYGSDDAESYRLVGTYTGKILKGDKPDDLPVQQSTKVELIVNLKTAKALGITVPLSLLGRADEVIE
jgi:putative tryptophan/tyrosine transport system substrate-binding protein